MATAAAAVMLRKQKQIVAAFRDAGAITAAAAIAPEAIGMHERLAFRRLVRRAVLRETSPDHYYLDEPTWEALRALRHRVAFGVLLVAIALAIFAIAVPKLLAH